MQELGRRYVAFFNFSMERTGTLWEGRFKSCLVDSETYLLRCYRYIELNPVRAGITPEPSGFRWSSFHFNGFGRHDPVITPHEVYQSLGRDTAERMRSYRAFIAQGCASADVEDIRVMTSRQRAFGGQEFKNELEARFHRPMGRVNRGRPRAEPEAE